LRKARCQKTIPLQTSIGEGLDIGEDVGSAAAFTYKPPLRFTGVIDKVTIDLKGDSTVGGR
jgi:arylsulfatase